MMVADAIALNRHQAISDHWLDTTKDVTDI